MPDDPYISIIEAMHGAAKEENGNNGGANVLTGVVKTVSPMLVQGPGIEITARELRVNHMLSFKEQEGSFDNRLKAGDTVLMATADMQLFYIICKL